MDGVIQSIGVFCGASLGEKESYSQKTRESADFFCSAGLGWFLVEQVWG